MKYGIITHYDVLNHGAMLQLNGLVQVLKQQGIEAKALQFEKNYDFMGREKRAKYELGLKSISPYIKFLCRRGFANFWFLYKKREIQNAYRKEKQLVGGYYTECEEFDGIVIGSDEVFALHTGPTPVFFGHALPSKKIFSYAGCFGPTTIEEIEQKHCRAFVESGLRAMRGLGMRDQNSKKIAEELTGRTVELVCDPVILYGYQDEIEKGRRLIKEHYLLVYAYDQRMNDDVEIKAIRDFAKTKNLIIISLGFYHKWVDRNVNTSPDDILSWFKYADYVVTDTFHGCVMGLITGREMAIKIRDNGNKLMNLLLEYGLTGHVISSDWNLLETFSRTTNWNQVNREILSRRNISMDYLKRMIEQ